MKRPPAAKARVKIALALTWDGAHWPVRSLPPKARAFLSAKGHATLSPRQTAQLFARDCISEMRICWVPRLTGGADVLAGIFPAPRGRRIPFRAVQTTRFGDVLGVLYRR